MQLGIRKGVRRTTHSLLALMAGTWLLAAAAPCVMAQPAPMPADHAGCCPDKALPPAADCDTLSALDCQLPKPVPPSATFDLPVPTVALLYTLPTALTPLLSDDAGPPPRTDISPTPPHLNRKHSRLLI